MKLNWVTIRVGDLDRSLKFYHELLGLNISARFGHGDHQIVMLGEPDAAKVELICGPDTKKENVGVGVTIGLEPIDLDALVAKLSGTGYQLVGPLSPSPHLRFYFTHDPDGYEIQLVGSK